MLLKKSLTHAGVLISLIILVVLMLLNWDKCFVNPIEKWFESDKIPPAIIVTAEGSYFVTKELLQKIDLFILIHSSIRCEAASQRCRSCHRHNR